MVREIVEAIGGKENILNVYHCATRLRFQLKQEGICFPWCVVGGSGWVIFSPAHTYRGVQCIESRHGLICGQCCLFPCVQGLSWMTYEGKGNAANVYENNQKANRAVIIK